MNTVVDSNISPEFGFEMALTKRKKIKAKSAIRSKKISEAATNRWYITTSIRTLKGEKEAE